jgi:hypothetical protein
LKMRLAHRNGLIHARKFQGGEIGVLGPLRALSPEFYLCSTTLGRLSLPQGRKCLS